MQLHFRIEIDRMMLCRISEPFIVKSLQGFASANFEQIEVKLSSKCFRTHDLIYYRLHRRLKYMTYLLWQQQIILSDRTYAVK